MHIITGVLLSMLFSKKKGTQQSPLLELRWPIITKHSLPGRIRFRIPLLAGQEKTMAELTKQLKKIDGITGIDTSPVTGSVLILYDEKKLQPDLLFTILIRLLDLEKELERTPDSSIKKGFNRFSQGVNQAIFTKSGGWIDLRTLVPLTLGITGLYRLWTIRPIPMPTAITMIWWAYNGLISSDKQQNKVSS